jgi:hypothetical protein
MSNRTAVLQSACRLHAGAVSIPAHAAMILLPHSLASITSARTTSPRTVQADRFGADRRRTAVSISTTPANTG